MALYDFSYACSIPAVGFAVGRFPFCDARKKTTKTLIYLFLGPPFQFRLRGSSETIHANLRCNSRKFRTCIGYAITVFLFFFKKQNFWKKIISPLLRTISERTMRQRIAHTRAQVRPNFHRNPTRGCEHRAFSDDRKKTQKSLKTFFGGS